jgi:thiamine-monophosphate kinase
VQRRAEFPETAMALGEFDLINRFFAPARARRALLGIGDDCALLPAGQPGRVCAITTDMLVSGRHFLPGVAPDSLGHKALAVNLSDLAAIGATPQAFTLALALPEVDEAWLADFSRGLLALAEASECELVGGDTTRGPLNISITALGSVPPDRALRRDRARAGDEIWVSGELGAAAYAVREAAAGRALAPLHPAQRRLDWPEPRLALGEALLGLAHAAIDLSDGLVGDLGHVLSRSGLAARVDWQRVPVAECLAAEEEGERQRLALAGGDDYELLFTAPVEQRPAIERLADRLGLALTRIGELHPGRGASIVDRAGRPLAIRLAAYDHFA